ncbi:adenosylcobinamide-GDP ribazoletransferase [Megasphaera sp.]|uniref:adenosylcobinamide-GDP ribazoletransferase n=1 Tax=Megasphaera sp. TaxID=2023260 RepID=UPI0025DF1F4D|nr:adenosylcobinamide-GDP ribazoletransferase [uncultured Megasphaera sp.]
MKAFLIALQFLSRIHLASQSVWRDEDFGRSVLFFPVVGLIIGLLLAALYWAASFLFDAFGRAVLVTAFWFYLTGGLHADGYMDTADGLFSGRSRERMLEILKDSRVGAGGVTAFVFLVLLKVTFLSQLAPQTALFALIGIPAAARFATLISIFQFPYAREQGLGKAFVTYAPAHTVEKAFFLALVPAFFCGPFYLALVGAAVLVSLWANLHISRKLGGVTGDTYGAVLELSEMLLLLFTAVGSKLTELLL